jgi:hypothetical protein
MWQSASVNNLWELAKYGEHVMNCPHCRPIEGRYCDVANELSNALYDTAGERQTVVRQPAMLKHGSHPRGRSHMDFKF